MYRFYLFSLFIIPFLILNSSCTEHLLTLLKYFVKELHKASRKSEQ